MRRLVISELVVSGIVCSIKEETKETEEENYFSKNIKIANYFRLDEFYKIFSFK
jgi:hypothetical protein